MKIRWIVFVLLTLSIRLAAMVIQPGMVVVVEGFHAEDGSNNGSGGRVTFADGRSVFTAEYVRDVESGSDRRLRAQPRHGHLPRDTPPESRASQSVPLLYRERVCRFQRNRTPQRAFQQLCSRFDC
jgi:hypothetical protein